MAVVMWLLYAVIGLLTFLWFRTKRNLSYFKEHGIPYEKPHFFFGNLWGIQSSRSFADVWMQFYKKFKGTGPFAGFYWFQKPSAFLLEPSLIKAILIKDFPKFTDRGFYTNTKDDPLSGQLFLLDGHAWRRMRSKLSPTFTSGKMKFMFPTVINVARQFTESFNKAVDKSNIVEVKELLACFTTDVIGTCAFGIECNSLKDPEVEFRVMGKKALVDTRYGKLGIAFLNSFPNLSRKLHLKQTPDHIENFFLRIVRETVDQREKLNIRRNDFMDMLIDLKNNKMLKSENGEDMTNLTLEEIAAQALVFFAAGFETSSTTMGFALYELAQHQDVQDRLRKEINEVLARHNGEFTYESIKEMSYLNQVISETLRLYTVLPVLNRCALEDYVVPDNPKYVIKKGMNIVIPIGAIHRDAEYYPNPNEFNPDHFEPEKVNARDPVLYLPFGDGPRNCIGMRFGQMQTRIGLATLLKDFKFSTCSETQMPMQYDKRSFLISSLSGIELKVERVA